MSLDDQMSSVGGLGVPPLQMTVSQMEDRTLVVVAGELDALTAPFLRQRFMDLLEEGVADVVLDVGLLKFVDSTGVALFLTIHKKLDALGHKLVIFSPTPMVRRIFQITGLTEFLRIEPQEPRAALRHRARRGALPADFHQRTS
jgi:anti-sigma B factor antagonist